MTNAYETGLDKTAANYAQLSPLGFIERAAAVYPDHIAIIHGPLRRTWAETFARTQRLASALTKRGIGYGDTVAVMGANSPETFECHFGVPITGAVLNALNVRLDAENIAFILDHAEAKVLITDSEFSPTVEKALTLCKVKPVLIDINDPMAEHTADSGKLLGEMDFEAFLAEGDETFPWAMPADEWQAISLNYTSGTTGDPKGVVYHHRGAYLNAMGNVVSWSMPHHPVYLWTLPMFHCNGWCFPWTLAAIAGTSVCLRKVNGANIYKAIDEHKVTHFCGAPIVLSFVINVTDEEKKPFDHAVNVMTAAAPPPASVLAGMKREGFDVTHVYGLTETYGPAVVCAWHDDWNARSDEEQAQLKSRQGVRYHVLQGMTVMNPETMQPVPHDGETMGEVMFQGNIVMKGYLKNPATTEATLAGDWFHSGDLGVIQPDGYLQIRDRSKDIIISGGENISSIEVEDVLYGHPAVEAAAVVAKQDDKWGETPCAFVELKEGQTPTEKEIIDHCRDNMAHYKCPRHVVFGPLPKTSTGKIQKFKLREAVQNA
ncbi:MAG: acyl-CoA synthetase [Alphaproteobacteria bacterium]|nr:acyl-CoA synthetase [Alphaproteobacteria bacterium]MBT4082832.1 acyl-CoA synthetase [Alphaproteobacteria bacterium]MBT4542418.1 acyl-CoA synthetase [Alphaproteobacteria bacterium]MBT7744979.1 acyl-CoA synthetase [Alphaproteobacteria bacterium]